MHYFNDKVEKKPLSFKNNFIRNICGFHAQSLTFSLVRYSMGLMLTEPDIVFMIAWGTDPFWESYEPSPVCIGNRMKDCQVFLL